MIFLSASVPYQERDAQYFETADIIAIRDAVRALATVVIPHSKLIWGGHPTITPLIRYVMSTLNKSVKDHVTIYQSNFFRDIFPIDNFDFEDIRVTKEGFDRENSLKLMRDAMIRENDFEAGIFIGGMEGVEQEHELFRNIHPNALIVPVASTGAAAKLIYHQMIPAPDKRLETEYAYMALFKSLLNDVINKS